MKDLQIYREILANYPEFAPRLATFSASLEREILAGQPPETTQIFASPRELKSLLINSTDSNSLKNAQKTGFFELLECDSWEEAQEVFLGDDLEEWDDLEWGEYESPDDVNSPTLAALRELRDECRHRPAYTQILTALILCEEVEENSRQNPPPAPEFEGCDPEFYYDGLDCLDDSEFYAQQS